MSSRTLRPVWARKCDSFQKEEGWGSEEGRKGKGEEKEKVKGRKGNKSADWKLFL